MNVIPYGKQHIIQEDIDAVISVLKSDFLTQGPLIEEFELAFAQYIGSKYAVAVANGTAALHLSAIVLGVKPGTKVITSPITFSASANCVKYCGGDIVFADIDKDTYVLSIGEVRKLLEKSPKGTYSGIIPIDFAGYPVDMQAFRKLADEYDMWIIEDACHAPGGYLSENAISQFRCGDGKYADLSIFSFHPVKHIAAGEGGMITTNDKDLYNRLKDLRTHGITKDPDFLNENHGGWYYEMQSLGYNYRLTDIQAALAKSQLTRAKAGIERRNLIAKKYDDAFQNTSIKIPFRAVEIYHAFHLYVIQVDRRKELYDFLRKANVYTQVHYIPVHLQPYYVELGWKNGDFPLAESYYSQCLSLPMYPGLTDDEQDYVISKILDFINE